MWLPLLTELLKHVLVITSHLTRVTLDPTGSKREREKENDLIVRSSVQSLHRYIAIYNILLGFYRRYDKHCCIAVFKTSAFLAGLFLTYTFRFS